MSALGFDRCCAEIVAQTDLLRDHVRGADMRGPVPSCPGWNLGQLLRHLGEAHRWAETVVRTRAGEEVSDARVNDLAGYLDEDGVELDGWLAEGAARLADTLRQAGPDLPVWSPGPDETVLFWARRMTHETVVHRADAALAAGAEFAVAPEVAVDALDEWMHFGTSPEAFGTGAGQPELLGPGRTLHLHATDTAPELVAEWLVDLTGAAPAWRRGHERAAAAARGPVADLLLFVYRRPAASIEVLGDADLLDVWRRRTGFWLE
ncbi:maleylpyruvate isomerase N-terminal domain-containing protein [Goodfellowiella coeruleoviolacea]|nr:maleylpyruvate isomerase N-terminal domain-containing protein [Goodfellowiella coeruleoviolacea]